MEINDIVTDGSCFDPNPVKTLGQGRQIGPLIRRSCFSTFIENAKVRISVEKPLMTKLDEM